MKRMNKCVFCIEANFLLVLEGLQAFFVIYIIHNMHFRLKSFAKPEWATENETKKKTSLITHGINARCQGIVKLFN